MSSIKKKSEEAKDFKQQVDKYMIELVNELVINNDISVETFNEITTKFITNIKYNPKDKEATNSLVNNIQKRIQKLSLVDKDKNNLKEKFESYIKQNNEIDYIGMIKPILIKMMNTLLSIVSVDKLSREKENIWFETIKKIKETKLSLNENQIASAIEKVFIEWKKLKEEAGKTTKDALENVENFIVSNTKLLFPLVEKNKIYMDEIMTIQIIEEETRKKEEEEMELNKIEEVMKNIRIWTKIFNIPLEEIDKIENKKKSKLIKSLYGRTISDFFRADQEMTITPTIYSLLPSSFRKERGNLNVPIIADNIEGDQSRLFFLYNFLVNSIARTQRGNTNNEISDYVKELKEDSSMSITMGSNLGLGYDWLLTNSQGDKDKVDLIYIQYDSILKSGLLRFYQEKSYHTEEHRKFHNSSIIKALFRIMVTRFVIEENRNNALMKQAFSKIYTKLDEYGLADMIFGRENINFKEPSIIYLKDWIDLYYQLTDVVIIILIIWFYEIVGEKFIENYLNLPKDDNECILQFKLHYYKVLKLDEMFDFHSGVIVFLMDELMNRIIKWYYNGNINKRIRLSNKEIKHTNLKVFTRFLIYLYHIEPVLKRDNIVIIKTIPTPSIVLHYLQDFTNDLNQIILSNNQNKFSLFEIHWFNYRHKKKILSVSIEEKKEEPLCETYFIMKNICNYHKKFIQLIKLIHPSSINNGDIYIDIHTITGGINGGMKKSWGNNILENISNLRGFYANPNPNYNLMITNEMILSSITDNIPLEDLGEEEKEELELSKKQTLESFLYDKTNTIIYDSTFIYKSIDYIIDDYIKSSYTEYENKIIKPIKGKLLRSITTIRSLLICIEKFESTWIYLSKSSKNENNIIKQLSSNLKGKLTASLLFSGIYLFLSSVVTINITPKIYFEGLLTSQNIPNLSRTAKRAFQEWINIIVKSILLLNDEEDEKYTHFDPLLPSIEYIDRIIKESPSKQIKQSLLLHKKWNIFYKENIEEEGEGIEIEKEDENYKEIVIDKINPIFIKCSTCHENNAIYAMKNLTTAKNLCNGCFSYIKSCIQMS